MGSDLPPSYVATFSILFGLSRGALPAVPLPFTIPRFLPKTPPPGRDPLDTGDLQLTRAADQHPAVFPGLLAAGDRLVPARGNRPGGGVPVRGVDGVSSGASHEDVGFGAVLHPVPAYLQV